MTPIQASKKLMQNKSIPTFRTEERDKIQKIN